MGALLYTTRGVYKGLDLSSIKREKRITPRLLPPPNEVLTRRLKYVTIVFGGGGMRKINLAELEEFVNLHTQEGYDTEFVMWVTREGDDLRYEVLCRDCGESA
jgi:hypothetical protein